MNLLDCIKTALLLVVVAFCLFEFILHRQSEIFRENEVSLLSLGWMLLVCLAVWCGAFLLLTSNLRDLPLIGLLIITGVAYFINFAEVRSAMDAIELLFGVTMGKAAYVLLGHSSRRESALVEKKEIGNQQSKNNQSGLTSATTFLIGLILLLAFSAFWHLDMTNNFYDGPRWMGLWNNPNDYGLLMGTGLVLAIGLLTAKERKEHKEFFNFSIQSFLRSLRSFAAKHVCRRRGDESHFKEPQGEIENRKSARDSLRRLLPVILFIAVGMMGVGLLFSYSRGAWIGTAIALFYLANAYGKFKWRWVLPPVLLVAAAVALFWNTPRTAPWYFQRFDMSRGSVTHRLAAWRAGVEMMWDHPFGVGWNNTVSTYHEHYSPPEDGAAAITTNDYLMLGTQLGWPGLICFVAYVALCFRNRQNPVAAGVRRLQIKSAKSEPPYVGCYRSTGETPGGTPGELAGETPALRYACRAGALAILVGFWFDGGLFKLATASVFWILLELGASERKRKAESGKAEIKQSLVTSAPTKQE